MRSIVVAVSIFAAVCVVGCGPEGDTAALKVSPEIQLHQNIAELRHEAKSGDLLVRLGDDLISERVKYLNDRDYSYSHAGMIIERDGEKYVYHISPQVDPGDTIESVAIDSFLNPAKNLNCALYRYELSNGERDSLRKSIEEYKSQNVRFDRVYDFKTDDRMYCSEMIAKALSKSTNERITCKLINVPKRMQPIVATFFKAEKITPQIVAKRKIVTVDNLYLMPQCNLLMKFPLKHLPDQQ